MSEYKYDGKKFHGDVQRIFTTVEGQRVLAEMEARYCRQNFDENPYTTARNCGQADLVQFLKSLTEEPLPDE